MFSQTVEYALRAAVHLAQRWPQACTTMEIAKRTRLPQAYLAKILLNLGRAGIVRSQRGLHGGFVLAKEPGQTTILEVVNAVEPIERIRSCPLRIATHRAGLCPLHAKLDAAMAWIESAFQESSLADLLEDPSGRTPLCESDPILVPLAGIQEGRTSAPQAASTVRSKRK